MHATAHGPYELHLDGRRVGDLELAPGFTADRSSLEVQTYDVTDLLTPGEHTLTATVTDGWWRGLGGLQPHRPRLHEYVAGVRPVRGEARLASGCASEEQDWHELLDSVYYRPGVVMPATGGETGWTRRS